MTLLGTKTEGICKEIRTIHDNVVVIVGRKKSTSIEKNEDDNDPMMRNVDVVVMERK